MEKTEELNLICQTGVMAIMRAQSPEQLIAAADAVVEGSVRGERSSFCRRQRHHQSNASEISGELPTSAMAPSLVSGGRDSTEIDDLLRQHGAKK